MSFLRVAVLAMLVLVLVTGCEEEMRPPPPPVDGSTRDTNLIRPPPPSDTGTSDSTAGDAALDAVVDAADAGDAGDSGLPRGCFAAGDGTGTTAAVASGGTSVPFAVTRAFATWDAALCSAPTIILGLTEGSCTPTIGDQLIFSLSRDGIETSSISLGVNTIVPEPDDVGLRVRFLTPGAGGALLEWGTCAGSSGTVDFSSVDALVGSRLTATYDLTLTDCRGASAPLSVSGSFDLPLEVSFESVCL